ncbi:5-oxoprolinase subunit PxpB [Cysteiniphilum halobium]|uniref:5-oxoprolinase subunit PxpB n=1 Tax=Cysteiniphilum halobium TaxID=2219059 RepID=UPI003F85269A
MQYPKISSLGDQGILIDIVEDVSPQNHGKVRALFEMLVEYKLPEINDIVPAFTSIAVHYDWLKMKKRLNNVSALDELEYWVNDQYKKSLTQKKCLNINEVVIPVCYDASFGLDIEDLAKHTNLDIDEVVVLHTSQTYYTYMIGFAPGFPYLGGLDQRLFMPRKKTPRLAVTKGSVGIAGMQTGVYTLDTPGGWNIIGRTPIRMYDFDKTPPSLIQMGDYVRFKAISKDEFYYLESVAKVV